MNSIILLKAFAYPVTMRYDKSDATVEILVMLLIAALLGFLLRHLLGYTRKTEIIRHGNSSKSASNTSAMGVSSMSAKDMNNLVAENKKLKADLAACKDSKTTKTTNNANAKSKTTKKTTKNTFKSTAKPPSKKTAKITKSNKATKRTKKTTTNQGKKDDLKVVEGIGPAIEKLLNNNNIRSYADLASADVKGLEKILDDAGPRFRVHVPETWTDQAKLLRDGKMTEFKKLTDELKGGRKK